MSDLYHRMLADPASFRDARYYDAYGLSGDQLHAIHLSGVRKRFSQLREQLPALDRLAGEQAITEISALDDVVPLLFPHTAYKSYPLNFLERGRFDALTRWLDGLTSVDLGKVDVTGVSSIDEWLSLLDRETPLLVNHTFGTSGKLSFIPRTKEQWRASVAMTGNNLRDWYGPDTGPDLLRHHLPLIAPSYRYGFSTTNRATDLMVQLFAGGDDNAMFLYPDSYTSADVASLAGRLRAAADRGEEGKLQLAPTLLARREEFARRERERPQALKRFFDVVQSQYAGRDIVLFGFWPVLSDWAEEGLAQGMRRVFGPNSVLISGGGTKGRKLPDRWRERIFEFMGFERYFNTFGMSEVSGGCPQCEQGNYHFPPFWIPYVLDLDEGTPMPRAGRHTGRLAVMDLYPDTYWGGLITGDLVTIAGWDEPCACGRNGPYMEPDIARISELKGGEDKISCAGAPDAHERAIDYIVSQSAA